MNQIASALDLIELLHQVERAVWRYINPAASDNERAEDRHEFERTGQALLDGMEVLLPSRLGMESLLRQQRDFFTEANLDDIDVGHVFRRIAMLRRRLEALAQERLSRRPVA